MKMSKVMCTLSLIAAVALVACNGARENSDEICQMQKDCLVKNCQGDDAASDCAATAEVNYKDCMELAEVSENARKHLPSKCADALEERIACFHDSFKCHEREVKIGSKSKTVYSVIYGVDCDLLGNYIEEKCTPEKENVIYIEDDNN